MRRTTEIGEEDDARPGEGKIIPHPEPWSPFPAWTSLGTGLGGRDACSDRCGTGVAGLPADVVALDDDDLDRGRRWT